MTQFRKFQDGEIVPGTRYRVVRLVGVGGMGSVYEVEHVELGKRFVLKALLRELARREDLVARLRNEWRALARLDHPCIVNVTDAGTSANGIPFYVMERLEGETLSARLRNGERMLVPEALGIAAAVLDGLSAAHEIGVIHRDVKPPNIFLVRGAVPKLLDFGVAKVTDASGVITARGIAIGTPRYMSPEQARGDSLDGRSDIYATGLILFEMIAGRGPFDDTHDANQLVLAHITREPPRLSNFVVVAPELDALVASMLEKDPRARPANARSLAVALKNLAERYTLSPSSDGPAPSSRAAAPAPDGLPPTRPDGVASRNSTPDATTRQPASSTREVTLRMSTGQILARAGMHADTADPTTLSLPGQQPSSDTVIDPPTFAGNTAHDAHERTEMLGDVESRPPSEAPPTRTAVPLGDSAPNLTPPPVVPSQRSLPERGPRRRIAIAVGAAFGAVLALLGLALGQNHEQVSPPAAAAVPAPPQPVLPSEPVAVASNLPPPAPEALPPALVERAAPAPPKSEKIPVLATPARISAPLSARLEQPKPKPQASQTPLRLMPGSGL